MRYFWEFPSARSELAAAVSCGSSKWTPGILLIISVVSVCAPVSDPFLSDLCYGGAILI